MSSVWGYIQGGRPAELAGRGRPRTRRPLPGERLELHPLEPAVGWFLTHYLNGRTLPCLGEACPCQRAEVIPQHRWQGYILAGECRTRRIVLASVTAGAFDSCEELRDRDLDLRGCLLTLTRLGSEANAPVGATVKRNDVDPGMLPALPYNHRDQLIRVWFNGKDQYEEVCRYIDLPGLAAPVKGAAEAKVIRPLKGGAK